MKLKMKPHDHRSSLTFFFLVRLLDCTSSSSSSSSTADEAQSPASFLHSSPLSPSFTLEATPTLSPSHPAFLLPSPAASTSTSSSSSTGLHCGIREPDSPTGSSSSRGSLGGGAVMSEAATRFSVSQMGSFSEQVGFQFCPKVVADIEGFQNFLMV